MLFYLVASGEAESGLIGSKEGEKDYIGWGCYYLLWVWAYGGKGGSIGLGCQVVYNIFETGKVQLLTKKRLSWGR